MNKTNDFSHLLNEDAPIKTLQEEIPLKTLQELVKKYKQAEANIADLEADLKEQRELFNKLSGNDIPALLLQHGLSEIKLKTGEKIKVNQEISPTIKDIDAFTAFLVERGDDDIVKTNLILGKLPAEILDRIYKYFVDTFDISPEIQRSVHTMTLKKYIKEICGLSLENPAEALGERYIAIPELPESVSVFTYFKTTIK